MYPDVLMIGLTGGLIPVSAARRRVVLRYKSGEPYMWRKSYAHSEAKERNESEIVLFGGAEINQWQEASLR